ncbi:restriction endonuclease [Pontibacter sp. G13]|uniref:restriction endonuclease n=1 Tax=Pontibacter sp. G13 TaxID=3074898 RepID=UPI00288B8C4A|nr:restriction endonuclease [Pontibacter sp. G13]WNJ18746.1 restriction endonuclease [Pontibacter sp. G13]
MKDSILIKKTSGQLIPFSPDKLRESLTRSGADHEIVEMVVQHISQKVQPGTSSKRIHQWTHQMLKKLSKPSAARFKLKRAIQELGPTGYPFEKFVGELLREVGWDVQTGVIVEGKCVPHEVDVLGDQKGKRISIECKFGNTLNKKVDVKVALYIHSRFQDLKAAWEQEKPQGIHSYEGWIVTNASFTGDAIRYGTCANLKLISWNYPAQGNLRQMIDDSCLYPITVLSTLTKAEKNRLLKMDYVLCRQVEGNEELLREVQVPESRIRKALNELRNVIDLHQAGSEG